MKRRFFCGASFVAVALSTGLFAQYARAADAGGTAGTEVTEVVVTGSYIAGTPEDSALPVTVLGSDELEQRGSPTVVQLVKTITASGAGIGESNRYNGGAGTASINLRGFGASRTLTLMNGRRLADSAQASFQGGGADLNFIPQAAVARVEILKDGAAATYGSEAIGGVVNFITRTDLNGLEVEGQYSGIKGSDGDYQASAAWGYKNESLNVLVTAGYRHRSRLDIHDRDWAIQPFEDIGYGGWTGAANPGFYVQNTVAGAFIFRDNGCQELGGTLTNTVAGVAVPVNPLSPASVASVCRFQFSNFNDLVNQEDHYQVYGQLNWEFSERSKLHAEVAWNKNDVPDQRLSPANLSTQFPTPISLGGTSGSHANPGALNFFVRDNVPANNPGLIDLRTTCAAPLTPAQCAAMGGAGGVDISQTVWRAVAFAGHPTNPDKADHQQIKATSYRVSAGLTGDLTDDIHYDTALTYMEVKAEVNTNDLLVDRIQLALNGFGSLAGASDTCDISERSPANAGNASVGCYFFNPFTNSIAVSAVTGQPNPYYRGSANSAVINNPKLVEWMYGNYTNVATNRLFVADAVISGKGWELFGGPMGWAVGVQYRWDRNINVYGAFNNYVTNPCVDSIDDGTPVCGAPAGPNIFFGSNADSDYKRHVTAAFGELKLPLFPSLDVTVALRHEAYSNGIGSTTNPKIAVKFQPLEWLAFRGSAGTTFRAPPSAFVNPGCATGVANIGGQYRAVRTCGNPALRPETANAYNAGILISPGHLTASLDYFVFQFKGELTAESASRLYASMFPTSSGHCGDPAFADLEARFQFSNLGCGSANVLRIDSYTVNGPSTHTSGLDFKAQYDFPDVLGGSGMVGVEGTYLLDYKRGAFTLLGNPSIVFASPEDRAGLHDLVAQFFSYPKLRANGWVSFQRGPFLARWQTRYTEGTSPAFGTPAFRLVPSSSAPGYVQEPLGKTDDYWQHDLIIRYQAPWETTITLTIQNIFDKDPADAPSQYNYDYTNGNPLGRVWQIGVKKRF